MTVTYIKPVFTGVQWDNWVQLYCWTARCPPGW